MQEHINIKQEKKVLNIPYESSEVGMILEAEPKERAKLKEKEKSPSPTNNI